MPRRGRSDLGGARASRAARLGARARKGRARAAAFPPAATQPFSQRPEPAGPTPSRAAAAAGTVTCRPLRPAVRAEGRPQASSPRQAALSPFAQSFSLRSSFQRGLARGCKAMERLECQRRSESAPTGSGRDSARAPLSGHVHNFAPPRSGHQAEGAGTSEPAGAKASRAPASRRMSEPRSKAGRRPRPAAAGRLQLRPGVRLPPRQLGRAAGSRWDHLFPAPAGSAERAAPAAPPPLQLASSQRPLQTGRCRRRLSRRRRCRACAPHARTPAWPPPPPQPWLSLREPAAPPLARPRPQATPTARAPRSTSAVAPQPGQWPHVWGKECGASTRVGGGWRKERDSKPRLLSQMASAAHTPPIPLAPMVQLRGVDKGGGGERSEVIGCLGGIPVGPQSPIG